MGAMAGAVAPMAAFLGPLGVPIAIASGVIGAAGAIQQGNAASAAANYNATILDKNRQTALENAARQQSAATQDEIGLRRKNAQFAGTQIASAAASGVDLSSGSMADAIGQTTLLNEEDALTLRENWGDRIRGTYADAQSMQDQAALTRAQGKAAKSASYINAASSLLASASTVAGKWDSLKAPTKATTSVFKGSSYSGSGPSGA